MVSTRWLSASCVVLLCATAAAASAQGISTGPITDQLQQLTSRRQLRNLHWGPPVVHPPAPRLPGSKDWNIPNEHMGVPTRPQATPRTNQGAKTEQDMANQMWRKQQEMLASARTCQKCQQTCASFNGRMVGANPSTGLPRICLSPMSAIKNCLELCEVTMPRVGMEG